MYKIFWQLFNTPKLLSKKFISCIAKNFVFATQMFLLLLRCALLILAVRVSSFGLSVLLLEQPRTSKSPPPSVVCALRLSAIRLRLLSVAKIYFFPSATLWVCALGIVCGLFVSLRCALLIKEEQTYTVPLAVSKTRSKP